MDSERKTYSQKAMETFACAEGQASIQRMLGLIESEAFGVFITVCDNKTKIVVDGQSLEFVTDYALTVSKDFPHCYELTITVDMTVSNVEGYQFTDDKGNYSLWYKKIPILYLIKNYSIKLREHHTLDLTVTFQIPKHRLNLKINAEQ